MLSAHVRIAALQSLAAARNCHKRLVATLAQAAAAGTAPRARAEFMVAAMRDRATRNDHLRAYRTLTGRPRSRFALGQTRVGLGA